MGDPIVGKKGEWRPTRLIEQGISRAGRWHARGMPDDCLDEILWALQELVENQRILALSRGIPDEALEAEEE